MIECPTCRKILPNAATHWETIDGCVTCGPLVERLASAEHALQTLADIRERAEDYAGDCDALTMRIDQTPRLPAGWPHNQGDE